MSEQNSAIEIYEQFRGLILSGQLGSGDRLPTVRQVANDLDVAPGTAAKAFKLLEADGLVVSRTGAGTRVSVDAALLPAPVVAKIRQLVHTAKKAEVPSDDIIAALRTIWDEP